MLRKRLDQMSRRIEALEQRLDGLASGDTARVSEVAVSEAPVSAAPRAAPPVTPPPVASRPAASGRRSDRWSRFEQRVGRRWLVWVGVLLLFLSAGFFVKLAIDNLWIGPGVQVIIAGLFGVGLAVAGNLLVRRMPAFGQGLVGGGMAVLYAAVWAASGYYGLIGTGVAFACMVAVTGAGMALALLRDAPPISILALLGGVLTPIVVSLGSLPRETLFGYLLVLDVGSLVVGVLRRWRILDLLACLGTWTLFSLWRAGAGSAPEALPAILWIDSFFLVFLAGVVAAHHRPATPITAERFGLLLANAAFAVTYSWIILFPARPRALGVQSLALAAVCFAAAAAWRRRVPRDDKSLFALFAVSLALVTAAAALEASAGVTTILWALEGIAAIFLGLRFRYLPGRLLGALVLALAVGTVFEARGALYGGPVAPALVVCLAALVVPVLFRWTGHDARSTPSGIRADSAISLGAGIFGGFLLLLVLDARIIHWLRPSGSLALGWSLSAGLWAAGGMAYLGAGIGTRSTVTRAAGLASLVAALALAWAADPGIWASLIVAAAWAGYGLVLRAPGARGWGKPSAWEKPAAEVVIAVAILASAGFTNRVWAAEVAATTVWGLAALACIAAGVWLRSATIRVTGFGATAAACALAVPLQLFPVPSSYPLFANARFGACMIVVAAGFLAPAAARTGQIVAERRAAGVVAWVTALGLLLLVSVEVYGGFHRLVLDPQSARWSSQAALSISWVLYAAGMLAYGFWTRRQAVRLVAIGLFVAAAAKVVLVDMATVQQLYRIVSGLAAGCVILGAAYLYYRLEKRLAGREPDRSRQP